MTPRVVFPNKLLPYILLAPQLAITLVFFYWPASQALRQSMLKEDPFGLRSRFVWFDNFEKVLSDPNYLNSVKVTVIFSVSTAFVAMALALLLAVMAAGASGLAWLLAQGGDAALVLGEWHRWCGRTAGVLFALHFLAVALHLRDFF